MVTIPVGTEWPLAGRRSEVALVGSVLENPGVRGLVLAGPMGVGKTRLALECLRLAELAGFATLRAVATRSAAAIPFGALAPLMPTTTERAEHRVDVLRQAVRGIEGRGGDRTVLLLVDDAHLLDDASAAVVHQLALGEKTFVVVTIRSGEPVSDPVTALWKDGLAHRADIEPLGGDEVEELVTAVLGGPVEGRTMRDLREISQGNPLFLRELLLGSIEGGLLTEAGGLWRLERLLARAPRLTDLVEARLRGLDEADRRALELAAVAEPIGLGLLVTLIEPQRAAALEARGLITVSDDGRRRDVRVAHPLYAAAIREQLPAIRAAEAAATVANAVEATGSRRREDVLRVGVWRLDAGGARPGLMLEAARRAYSTHGNVLAERLARAAIDADGGFVAGLLLGTILLRLGRAEESVRTFEALRPDNDLDRARLAVEQAAAMAWGLERHEGAVALLTEVAGALGEAAARDEVLAARAQLSLLGGRPDVALAAVETMLRLEGGRTFVQAAIGGGVALALTGRCDEAVSVADRAFMAHLELGNEEFLSQEGIHVVYRVLALALAGRFDDAETTARIGYDHSINIHVLSGQAWFSTLLGWVAAGRGQLTAALRWTREAAAAFAELDLGGPRRWALAIHAFAGAQAGADDETAWAISQIEASSPNPFLMLEPLVERARAWALVSGGNIGAARGALLGAADQAAGGGAASLELDALHDLVRLGGAQDVDARLASVASRVDGPLAEARTRHARAALEGDGTELASVADDFEAIGALLVAAEVAAEAAAAFRNAGERRKATRMATRSVDLARQCESPDTPALALAGEAATLTAREREVATLAAQGLSSRAIGDQLFVSHRTIDNLLHRVYSKLGISSRADLATALAAHGDPRAGASENV